MTTTLPSRKPYPTDVSDEEWAFVAPYLTLLAEDALQRCYPLREVFNALRWIVRAGAPWRLLPTNFPPWPTVYQQARRWVEAGCFEALVHDLFKRQARVTIVPGWAELVDFEMRAPRFPMKLAAEAKRAGAEQLMDERHDVPH